MGIGKEFLETLLRPVDADYRCHVFRAANWAVQPSRNVVRALVNNGIDIDTSVFKYGRREGIVSFDYSNAPDQLIPWPAAEVDVCDIDPASTLWEYPIYCERRWLPAFLTQNRISRVLASRRHQIRQLRKTTNSGRVGSSRRNFFGKLTELATKKHAWKADFNQCTGLQLVHALRRASRPHESSSIELPFVLIGHSKIFAGWNERSLEIFLSFAADEPSRFAFGKLSFNEQSPELLGSCDP